MYPYLRQTCSCLYLSAQISCLTRWYHRRSNINHRSCSLLIEKHQFHFKFPASVQEECVMQAQREPVQAYAALFLRVPLADLNVLLTTDMFLLRGSCNARNSRSHILVFFFPSELDKYHFTENTSEKWISAARCLKRLCGYFLAHIKINNLNVGGK